MTQQEFNQMLAVAIAGGLGGGTYISRWDGEQIDNGIAKLQLPGGITTTELADGAVTWPKLAVDARPTRRNLLINSRWDILANIVNQLGLTEYTGAGRTIDRWILSNNICKLIIESDGIRLTQNSVGNNSVFLVQKKQIAELPDEEYTFSAIVDNELLSITFDLSTSMNTVNSVGGKFRLRAQYINGVYSFSVYGYAISPTDSCKIVAAKLELGPNQTLAHQDAAGNWVLNDPPQDYGLELLKCQRYFQTFATQSERPTKGADFRPVMRTENPTLGTITLPDGTVLYTASSEL